MRTLIIEDEPQAVSALKLEIATHCPEIELVGEAASITEGISQIKKLQPALVFLDIQLADGLGLDILSAFEQRDFKVIFTTAYSQYAITAIKFSALDYLLKPIDSEELVAAVKKASKSSGASDKLKVQHFVQNLSEPAARKKIALQTTEGIAVFEISNIIKCSSESNYTCVYFENGKKMLFSKTLKEFEELLSTCGFERVHHSHLINLNHLTHFVNKDGGYVILSDKTTVPVSQRKRTQLIEALNQLKF